MINRSEVARRPKAYAAAATVVTLALVGAGVALAKSESLQSSTALSTPAPAAQQTILTGFADIVESVRPAVVSIDVTRRSGQAMSMTGERYGDEDSGEDEGFGDFYERFFGDRRHRGEPPTPESFKRWFPEFQERRGEGHGHRCCDEWARIGPCCSVVRSRAARCHQV